MTTPLFLVTSRWDAILLLFLRVLNSFVIEKAATYVKRNTIFRIGTISHMCQIILNIFFGKIVLFPLREPPKSEVREKYSLMFGSTINGLKILVEAGMGRCRLRKKRVWGIWNLIQFSMLIPDMVMIWHKLQPSGWKLSP